MREVEWSAAKKFAGTGTPARTVSDRFAVLLAWTLAKEGQPSPEYPEDPYGTHLCRLAWHAQRGETDSVLAVIDSAARIDQVAARRLLREAEGLIGLSATGAAGLAARDALPFHRYLSGEIVACGLADSNRAECLRFVDRLLEEGRQGSAVASMGEVRLRLLDCGKTWPEMDTRWNGLGDPEGAWAEVWWEVQLRTLARSEVGGAIEVLADAERAQGDAFGLERAEQAIAGRLPPERARTFAAAVDDVFRRLVRIEGSLWNRPLEGADEALLREAEASAADLPSEDLESLHANLLYHYVHGGRIESALELLQREPIPPELIIQGGGRAVRRLALRDRAAAVEALEALASWISDTFGDPVVGLILRIEGGFDTNGPWWTPFGSKLP
jgi:hypothetical protein